jgi:hypothetical protein
MSKALTTLEPQSIGEAVTLCQHLVQTGFLPRSIKNPEQALAILMAGRDFGLSAMQSFRAIHIIEGKPTLSADFMVGLALGSGHCEYFRCVSEDDKHACYETKRHGSEPVRRTFTIEDAKAAGLLSKDVWRKYTRAMLRARCKADLARDTYPDALAGCYDPDELDQVSAPQPAQQNSSEARVIAAATKVSSTAELPEPEVVTAAKPPVELTQQVVLAAIANASTKEELFKVRELAKRLPTSERAECRTAYAARVEEMSKQEQYNFGPPALTPESPAYNKGE